MPLAKVVTWPRPFGIGRDRIRGSCWVTCGPALSCPLPALTVTVSPGGASFRETRTPSHCFLNPTPMPLPYSIRAPLCQLSISTVLSPLCYSQTSVLYCPLTPFCCPCSLSTIPIPSSLSTVPSRLSPVPWQDTAVLWALMVSANEALCHHNPLALSQLLNPHPCSGAGVPFSPSSQYLPYC